jgi:hypothetical protein
MVEGIGEVVVLSSRGDLLARCADFGGMSGLVVADVVGDGKAEVVAGGTDGRLIMFDGELNVLGAYADTTPHTGFESRRLTPLVANDVDGDGEVEVAALSTGWTIQKFRSSHTETVYDSINILVVVDPGLRPEAQALVPPIAGAHAVHRGGQIPTNSMITDLDCDGVNEIVLVRRGTGAYVFKIGS